LEEIDMADDLYQLGCRSDQEGASSVNFEIPEEILDPLDSGSESDPDQIFGDDEPMESDDPVIDETLYGSLDSDFHDGVPDVIKQLQKELLNGYTHPPPPAEAPQQRTLSKVEILSLKHYMAWAESHGTVKAYNFHAKVLTEATEEEILTLYKVKQLAMNLTGMRPTWVEMCPRSCMAFTGQYQAQSTCSYGQGHKSCNESRYRAPKGPRAKLRPRATMLYVPIIPIIQAFYANKDTSHQMRHRDECLKSVLSVAAKAAGRHPDVDKSEFANSDNHIDNYNELGLF
jgi:hypothetical protein